MTHIFYLILLKLNHKINIKLSDDLTIIDTPGLVDRGNIINYVENFKLKKRKKLKSI